MAIINILNIDFNTSIVDSTGHYPTINATGSPTLDLSHTVAPTGVGTFHPTARYLSIPNFSLGSGDWSFSCKLYLVSTPTVGYGVSFISFGSGVDGTTGFNLAFFYHSGPQKLIDAHFNYSSAVATGGPVDTGVWIPVKLEKIGGIGYITINGVPGGVTSDIHAIDFNTPRTLYIGTGSLSWESPGESDLYIDDVYVTITVPYSSVYPTLSIIS